MENFPILILVNLL